MNTLLVLLVTTSAPAADPQPLPLRPTTSGVTITYTESAWSEPAQESRPRFFGKIRNFVSRKWTRLTDRVAGSGPVADEENGPYVAGDVPSPTPPTPRAIVPDTSAPPRIRRVWGEESPEPPLADPIPSRPAPVPPPG